MTSSSIPDGSQPAFLGPDVQQVLMRVREPLCVVQDRERGRVGVALGGELWRDDARSSMYALLASLPPLFPEWLGDRAFGAAHRVRFPYIAGEMARGIATPQMVVTMARAEMLSFFGAAGLSISQIEAGLDVIERELGSSGLSWGSNLIHSLDGGMAEDAVVSTYLRRGIQRVSASAFMSLTPAVVRYACSGLHLDSTGRIQRTNHMFAKVSSPEVARHFMSPAPAAMVDALVASRSLTREEAMLARYVAVAEDITVEGDSGGHTDNRPLAPLFSHILQLSQDIMGEHQLARPIRVGAAGGLGTPAAVAAAFSLGAAYVLTGSINQAAIESSLSEDGKRMLAQATLSDVAMAPSADMFELGVKVQVLKRGTMFAVRARELYDLYRTFDSLEGLPAPVQDRLEREIFRAPLQQIWDETRAFFQSQDPTEMERAERDPKHRMALVCRWYLGRSSRWPITGTTERRVDYQIWCGPAMGAFNSWAEGSFLEHPWNRSVVQIARNLLEGAAVVTRAQQLRTYGVAVPAAAFHFRPRPLA